jgi:hypothetical protein
VLVRMVDGPSCGSMCHSERKRQHVVVRSKTCTAKHLKSDDEATANTPDSGYNSLQQVAMGCVSIAAMQHTPATRALPHGTQPKLIIQLNSCAELAFSVPS